MSDAAETGGLRDPSNAFAPGTLVDGKFRIEGVIGVGGMGTVLAAHHLGLDKPVALKVLLDQLGDRSAIQRLLREARAVAQLESAGVARVLDVGYLASGSPYIVMERLIGMNFGALLKIRGVLSVDEAARYVIEACAPLEEAHGVGIVHRDLKPQNLFLAETKPGRKMVKVLDFGISRFDPKTERSVREEALTAQYEILGTPFYMPPEQIGGARNADARSDVYSLGACLYHFVAGHPPIVGSGLSTVLSAIRNDVPKRLDAVRNDVPSAFADIVARCLEKAPEARFPTILALREALSPFAAVSVPPPALAREEAHLDDELILAMQEGALEPAALARAQHHLVLCAECRELVALAAEATMSPLDVTGRPRPVAGTLALTRRSAPAPVAATAAPSVASAPGLATSTLPLSGSPPPPMPSTRATVAVMVSRSDADASAGDRRGQRTWWPLVGGALVIAAAGGTVALLGGRSLAGRSSAGPTAAVSIEPAAVTTPGPERVAATATVTASATLSPPPASAPLASAAPSSSASAVSSAPRVVRGSGRKGGASPRSNGSGSGIPDER